MKKEFTSTFVAGSGIIAALMAAAAVTLPGNLLFGYSNTRQLISEVITADPPGALLWVLAGFVPLGLLSLLFVARLGRELATSFRSVIGLVFIALCGINWLVTALGYFWMDSGLSGYGFLQLQNLSGFLSMLLVPIGILLLLRPLRQAGFGKPVMTVAIVVVAISIASFVVLGFKFGPDIPGLVQRINIVAFYSYLCTLSVGVCRRQGRFAPSASSRFRPSLAIRGVQDPLNQK